MTTPLSPTAQAVLDAAHRQPYMDPDGRPNFAGAIAAAFREAALRVVPDGPRPTANFGYHLQHWSKSLDQYDQRQATRAELLAIATELDPNG